MPTLIEIFSDIADAIRTKTGKSEGIYPVDMASEIEGIESGGGYKLEKMPSGAVSSFNDGAALPLNNLKISIEPIQSGSGDPSPTNIRPISGWDEVKVTVADDVETPTVSNVYTIDLDGTRYGGELDVVSGVLTVNRISKTLTSNENFAQLGANNVYIDNWTDVFKPSTNTLGILQCSHYEEKLQFSGNHYAISKPINNRAIVFYDDDHATSVADFKAYITSQTNNGTPIKVCYKLENPLIIQLTPTAVKSLLGTNNIWADTGDIINGEYFKGEESSGSGIIYYIKNIRIECEVI